MAKVSPTQRSLKLLREQGWTCQVVEHWNSFAKIRVDLYGVIDILAMSDNELLAVQATSYSNHSARMAKALLEPRIKQWVRGPGRRFEVWGWRKIGGKWAVKREPLRIIL